MSMLDSFFNKGFKAAKCKTLLKLTIPRIKLLRNRREIQIKQMRRDIAKLLETGQEATARIRVEHIIREEKMMAAQEIIELFCELITVRLPIIEAQRECPLDLKEAISSICFAAPRCADLPELLQVQMLFVGKYGKEFVSAATELMPECGVNRQLVELLSVRAPAPDVKLKMLKDIAEEHELDWDPAASETELLKPHEDLLNGPTQFVSGSKLPLPKEKHDEVLYSASVQASTEQSNPDAGFDPSDFPEVPKASLRPIAGTGSAPEMLPFPASALSGFDPESPKSSGDDETLLDEGQMEPEEVLREKLVTKDFEWPNTKVSPMEDKQFLPFISPPSMHSTSSASFSASQSHLPPSPPRTKSDFNVDLQDVLAAAEAAAESAERAAAAARSAASLAQIRITELAKNRNDEATDIVGENPFHVDTHQSHTPEKQSLDHENSFGDSDVSSSPNLHLDHEYHLGLQLSNLPSYNRMDVKSDPTLSNNCVIGQGTFHHQPQRLDSINDETYFSFPNLFTHGSNPVSRAHSFVDKTHSTSDN